MQNIDRRSGMFEMTGFNNNLRRRADSGDQESSAVFGDASR